MSLASKCVRKHYEFMKLQAFRWRVTKIIDDIFGNVLDSHWVSNEFLLIFRRAQYWTPSGFSLFFLRGHKTITDSGSSNSNNSNSYTNKNCSIEKKHQ